MSVPTRKLILPAASILLIALVAAVVALQIWLNRADTVLSDEVSPDGSWGITVVASPKWNGAYEIVAQIKNDRGEIVSAFVKGLSDNVESIRDSYNVVFLNADEARIGDLQQTIQKSRYFQ